MINFDKNAKKQVETVRFLRLRGVDGAHLARRTDLFCIAFCVRVGKGWKNLLNQAFLAIPFGAANTPVHAKKLDNSGGFVLEYDE
jgi:hypothetical protein